GDQALAAGMATIGALREQARAEFRKAGVAFEQAAGTRTGLDQADGLWRSATCFMLGQAYTPAAAVLTRFVALDLPPERKAQGWFSLAEAHTALEQKDEARTAYHNCIAFPTSPVAYQARYQLALVEIEQHNLEQAEKILRQNLSIV